LFDASLFSLNERFHIVRVALEMRPGSRSFRSRKRRQNYLARNRGHCRSGRVGAYFSATVASWSRRAPTKVEQNLPGLGHAWGGDRGRAAADS
jgi:hypothetical protein